MLSGGGTGSMIVEIPCLILHGFGNAHDLERLGKVDWLGTKGPSRRGADVGANELAKLRAAVERQAAADGMHETRIPALAFYRASMPSEHDASEYEPSVCIIVQGAKEILLGDEEYRYDPAHALVVSVDLPAHSRVVEASPDLPCLAVRVSLDPAVVDRKSVV